MNKKIFNKWVDTGTLPKKEVKKIVQKIKHNKPLSVEEMAVFQNEISTINKLLEKDYA